MNLISIEAGTNQEEVLAITRKQEKVYLDPAEEAWAEIEKGM